MNAKYWVQTKNHKVKRLFMNQLSGFDRFPTLLPSIFFKDNDFMSLDDIFNRVFTDTKVKQMYVYPTNIYNLMDNDKKIATVIEIAAAGFSKENTKVSLEDKVLTVELGHSDLENSESDNSESLNKEKYTKEYIQKNIAGRYAKMSWTLSNDIDTNKIEVEYINGILSITLPVIQKKENISKYLEIK